MEPVLAKSRLPLLRDLLETLCNCSVDKRRTAKLTPSAWYEFSLLMRRYNFSSIKYRSNSPLCITLSGRTFQKRTRSKKRGLDTVGARDSALELSYIYLPAARLHSPLQSPRATTLRLHLPVGLPFWSSIYLSKYIYQSAPSSCCLLCSIKKMNWSETLRSGESARYCNRRPTLISSGHPSVGAGSARAILCQSTLSQ